MKKFVLAAFIFAAAYAPSISFADEKSDMYFDIGVASLNTKMSDTGLASAGASYATSTNARFPNVGFSTSALRTTFGKRVHKNLDVEFMTMMGLSESTDRAFIGNLPLTVGIKLEPSYGLYLKPKAKISDTMEVFGRVGYFRSKYTATVKAQGVSVSESGSEGDISLGYGAMINLTNNASLTFDYMHYMNKVDVKTDGFGLGLKFNF